MCCCHGLFGVLVPMVTGIGIRKHATKAIGFDNPSSPSDYRRGDGIFFINRSSSEKTTLSAQQPGTEFVFIYLDVPTMLSRTWVILHFGTKEVIYYQNVRIQDWVSILIYIVLKARLELYCLAMVILSAAPDQMIPQGPVIITESDWCLRHTLCYHERTLVRHNSKAGI